MIFLLSRIQFALSIGFHFLFPATTLGLVLYIIIFETLYVVKNDLIYKSVSSFLIRILGSVFVMGVATGLILPFTIGSNWGRFSLFSGELFGVQLSIESIVAFTLESCFLAVVVFGREKVSKKVYLFSVYMVFFGSYLSAFLITSANSWMHTPAGYMISGNKIIVTDLIKAVFNPSAPIRFIHTVLASWLSGTLVVAACGAYFLLKGRHSDEAKKMFFVSVVFLAVLPLVQIWAGHSHILEVSKYNPEKGAAYEGVFKTGKSMALYVFAIPDRNNKRVLFPVSIPYMLSFLDSWSFDAEVTGLDRYPENEWPPVNVIFTTFHLMFLIGTLLLFLSFYTLFLMIKKRLFESKLFFKILIFSVPLPYLATELGWAGTEIGRQPWIIYRLLRTADATSLSNHAGNIISTLIITSLIYIMIALVFGVIIKRIMREGMTFDNGKDH